MQKCYDGMAGNAGDELSGESMNWSTYFRAQREGLELTQIEMSALLACGEKSYCRWENGAEPTPMVIKLLRCVIALKSIMRFSYGGCQFGCLNCGEVNELADHALRDAPPGQEKGHLDRLAAGEEASEPNAHVLQNEIALRIASKLRVKGLLRSLPPGSGLLFDNQVAADIQAILSEHAPKSEGGKTEKP